MLYVTGALLLPLPLPPPPLPEKFQSFQGRGINNSNAVLKLKRVIKNKNRNVHFSFLKGLGRTAAGSAFDKIVQSKTGELLLPIVGELNKFEKDRGTSFKDKLVSYAIKPAGSDAANHFKKIF